MNKLTLLELEQVLGENRLEIFEKRGTKAAITDFAILSGGSVSDIHSFDYGKSLRDRTGDYWTKTYDGYNLVQVISKNDSNYSYNIGCRNIGLRPILPFSSIDDISTNGEIFEAEDGLLELEYGYLPKWAVSRQMQLRLESLYGKEVLKQSDFGWTIDLRNTKEISKDFLGFKYVAYEYKGKFYVRIKANFYNNKEKTLSNGVTYNDGDYVWVEVEPVSWIVSLKDKIMISEEVIASGIAFNSKVYDGNFDTSDINFYLQNYLFEEMFDNNLLNSYFNRELEKFFIGPLEDCIEILNSDLLPLEEKNSIIHNRLFMQYTIANNMLKKNNVNQRVRKG